MQLHFQWDNYHSKSHNPVRIMVRSEEPPFRGNVSHVQSTRFANNLLSELVELAALSQGPSQF
jgi:hypothetical protein